MVKNSAGQARTVIHASDVGDADCGDLVTAGQITVNNSNLSSDPSAKEMVFKDGAGNIIALIADNGNIKLKGVLYVNQDISD